MAIVLIIVGLFFYTNTADILKNPKQKTTNEITAEKQADIKTPKKVVKPIPKPPEPIKKEIKVKIKKPELIKEEVKAEVKQPDPKKEIIKEEPKVELQKLETEDIKANESESNYLKIILYIVGAIAAIFGGFYLFSNRGNSKPTNSTVETARKDIEENYQPETQEQEPAQEETQTETQEQEPAQEETQTETQQQEPAQEETQTETQEQQSTEDEENNNK